MDIKLKEVTEAMMKALMESDVLIGDVDSSDPECVENDNKCIFKMYANLSGPGMLRGRMHPSATPLGVITYTVTVKGKFVPFKD